MKLKKLLKTIPPYQPFVDALGECRVISIRNVYDELQLPDYQDIIEIKLQGGK